MEVRVLLHPQHSWNWESQVNPLAWGARDHRFESDIPYNGGLDAVAGSTPAFGISFLERNVPVVELSASSPSTFRVLTRACRFKSCRRTVLRRGGTGKHDPILFSNARVHKSKVKRLLTKNIRRSIGIWNWKYWLMRIEQQCEENRISFRSVAPYYTSQTCPNCNHVDRKNRNGIEFKCQSCGHTDNADINAALNIMNRFILGKYGSQYKQENLRTNRSDVHVRSFT